MKNRKMMSLVLIVLLLQACSHTANFSSVPAEAEIKIGKTQISGVAPQTGSISNTTFGRYPVKVQKDGYKPIYGNLPLKVSPGIIILDALLFAPAAFFNVQRALSFYEFDLDQGVIKYKKTNDDKWETYVIPEDQKNAAKVYFGDK